MLPRAEGGVVDPTLLVYGTTNVRVADMSVVPLLPGTHASRSLSRPVCGVETRMSLTGASFSRHACPPLARADAEHGLCVARRSTLVPNASTLTPARCAQT